METVLALGVLIGAVILTILNPNRRDEEVERRIATGRKIRRMKEEVGVRPSFKDTAMSRLGDN